MAQNSDTPKFPAPIPNPLSHEQAHPKPVPQVKANPSSQPDYIEDDKTDPEIILPQLTPAKPAPVSQPNATPATPQPTIAAAAPVQPSVQTPPRPAPRMPEMGPLDTFMKDPSISEIMVNDLRNVMIEKDGKLQFSGFAYQGIDELNRLVRNILDITGRLISPDSPYVDVMLPDGSRVNIVAPPLTIQGPCITIRKFPSKQLSIHDLIRLEALDQRIAYFLNCCVVGRMNILICGGTGGGKTTLLNVLSTFIPKGERLITDSTFQ
jgi:hypothetical protein